MKGFHSPQSTSPFELKSILLNIIFIAGLIGLRYFIDTNYILYDSQTYINWAIDGFIVLNIITASARSIILSILTLAASIALYEMHTKLGLTYLSLREIEILFAAGFIGLLITWKLKL